MRVWIATALIALLAALLWPAGEQTRADAPPQPQLRRAEPWLTLAAQPRFTLRLTSSRDLCTAGTLTEISWQISGGAPPYTLSIDGESTDPATDNIHINCGALTEAETADAEATLAAKTITAVVTDSRGVRRKAALDVARARALPAPEPTPFVTYSDAIVTDWRDDDSKLSGTTSLFLIRWRSTPSTGWSYKTLEHTHRPFNVVPVYLDDLSQGTNYQFQFTALRDRIEAETPNALQWALRSATTLAPPTGLSATATHDTVTVTWDTQPSASFFYVWLDGPPNSEPPAHDSQIYTPADHDRGQTSVVFNHVPPDRDYTVRVRVGSSSLSENSEPLEAMAAVRTRPAPPAWTGPLRGAQRVRATATDNSITVTWDAPYPEASGDDYHLMLFHPTRSGIRHERVYNGTTAFTFDNLEPGLTYRVAIDHIAIVESRTETEVTTLPASATGAVEQTRADAPPPPQLRRAEPWLTLVAQPRFTLWLASSRDLCTAGTLTEISWQISGGAPPYTLSIDGESTDPATENIRINCGALTETEAADAEAALAAKTITAVVTDSRGIRRKAALEVARAKALPAPELTDITAGGHRTIGNAYWNEPTTASTDLVPAHYLVRWRTAGSDVWAYDESVRELSRSRWMWSVDELHEGTSYELSIAAMRDLAERLTPEILRWSGEVSFRTVASPQNVVATSTHSTITVTWSSQPGNLTYAPFVTGPHGSKDPSRESANVGTHRAVFTGLQPDTAYEVLIPVLMTEGQEVGASTTIRTKTAPTGWSPLPAGPQNLR